VNKCPPFDSIIFERALVHGRPQGGQNEDLPALEIGTKKQKFLENVKSAV